LFKRLFFRKKKKSVDRSGPYVVQPGDEKHENNDEALVRVIHSESDPELSKHTSQTDENGMVHKREEKKGDSRSSRQAKAKSTAFEHIAPVSVTGTV
jgi:hypothetical protein